MKTLLIALAVLVVIAAVAMLQKTGGPARAGGAERPRRKKLFLTEREQSMHNRLTQALPDLIVLTQVSFSALITAKAYAVRNTFDRKTADFVVCDKAFQVLAVIELDDASHKGKEEKDGARDALLTNAGYRVLRYPNIPDIDRVRTDFAPKEVALPQAATTPAARVEPVLTEAPALKVD